MVLGLDTFGDDLEPETVGELDDVLDDELVLAATSRCR